MTVRFSKILCYAGTEKWEIEPTHGLKVIPFPSKKELVEYYGLKNVSIVDETFAITPRGNRRIYKIYEGKQL